ncbi:VRR-NUC domain-containing protein [Pseudomonas aeruginosa]|uniref:VRR-NUC domain-containing protein n=1 Tax=Pseudomonas aeruginosa TaxID=287 RepID=UPI0022891976|nr:VRR-NUC domain-containing protein [Pseudomonas aeruginosa]HBO0861726.1 VRR-NUC domain-containing protein [Pseudomonas aeruginosa]HBO5217517.1 VRR-NUC domain-containing protein [Pseudomonas aeruginosa]HCE6881955.1 VRR-NUC domain-containing protein [Pseudomonas aeruginosa]HCE9350713.1 VRR-NUC domain-containing protein [Pseudomonas aeruginosa]
MPAPVAAGAAIVWGYRAYRTYQAYETAQTAKEALEMVRDIAKRKEEVKQVLKSTIDSFSREIDEKSSTFAKVDAGGRSTVSRRGKEGTTYKEYIERKVPFRSAISIACNWALSSPIKVPRRIRKKIPGNVVETTIEVALKQTTASLIFESIDDALEWRSPLKAEPNYLGGAPLLGEPSTRPKRISELFPFWPRPRGSLAPDLVIVEYRQQPFHVSNVFAAVEIKFPRDWVNPDQLRSYVNLMGRDKRKVALLRVPEDCTGYQAGDGDDSKQTGRTGGKGRK